MTGGQDATVLDRIVAAHRRHAAGDDRNRADLERAAAAAPAPRPFRAALGSRGLAVIAEVKRRSPSKGALAPDLDPAALAKAYEGGGAACLSVLTDTEFFGGSGDDLAAAREACSVPILRKDFTVADHDVFDARAMGADAVLLIAAALDDAELARFLSIARDLDMAALVEVHDDRELDRAAAAGADVIGVNQRDLRTFEVDRDRAATLAARMPDGAVTVAESGIAGPADAARLHHLGYDAVLVGESLVTADDPGAAVRALVEAHR